MKKTSKFILVNLCIVVVLSLFAGCGCKHDFEEKIVKDVTCGSSGLKELTCMLCEEKTTEEIPPTGAHTTKEEITKLATCISEGEKTLTCIVCNKITTEKIPTNNNHLTAQGTCSRCNQSVNIYSQVSAELKEDISLVYDAQLGILTKVAEVYAKNLSTNTIVDLFNEIADVCQNGINTCGDLAEFGTVKQKLQSAKTLCLDSIKNVSNTEDTLLVTVDILELIRDAYKML